MAKGQLIPGAGLVATPKAQTRITDCFQSCGIISAILRSGALDQPLETVKRAD